LVRQLVGWYCQICHHSERPMSKLWVGYRAFYSPMSLDHNIGSIVENTMEKERLLRICDFNSSVAASESRASVASKSVVVLWGLLPSDNCAEPIDNQLISIYILKNWEHVPRVVGAYQGKMEFPIRVQLTFWRNGLTVHSFQSNHRQFVVGRYQIAFPIFITKR